MKTNQRTEAVWVLRSRSEQNAVEEMRKGSPFHLGKQVKTRFLEIMQIDFSLDKSLDRCRMLAKIKVASETSRDGMGMEPWETLYHLENGRRFGRNQLRVERQEGRLGRHKLKLQAQLRVFVFVLKIRRSH